MTQAHSRTVDTEAEVIEILVTISQVSARMARNMSILAAQRQTEEGGKHYEQNERYGRDHRRTAQCRCRY